MATQQPMSLFGVTPALIRQQQEGVEQQRMMQQAQMTPWQQLNMSGREAGRGMGQSLGKMFGVTPANPAMERAAKLKAAGDRAKAKGFDSTRPEKVYEAMAEELANEGLYDEALQATEQARKIKEDREASKTKALTAEYNMMKVLKGLQGKPDAEKIFELVKGGKYDPASVKKFEETGDINDLKMKATDADGFVKIGAADTGEPVYRDKDGSTEQYILRDGKKVPFYGSIRKEQGDVTVTGGTTIMEAAKDIKPYHEVISKIRTDMKPAEDTLRVAQNIAGLLPQAMKPGNAALGGLRQQFASLFKVDSQMGQKEIAQISSQLGGLDQRLFDRLSQFFSGTVTYETAKAIEQVLDMVEKNAVAEIEQRLDRDEQVYKGAEVPQVLTNAFTSYRNDPKVKGAKSRIERRRKLAEERGELPPTVESTTTGLSPDAMRFIEAARPKK